MQGMSHENLIMKLGGRGIPAVRAQRYLRGLLTKNAQLPAPDPLYDAISRRPVTEEIVDDSGDDYLGRAGQMIAEQQAEVDQAKAEATYAVQTLQQVQQQAGQQLGQLQQQLQELSSRTQQAEQGLAQAQQGQTQAAMQMAQLQQEAVSAGQVALEARQEAFQNQRAQQDLMQRLTAWKSQLQQVIDQDPVQQLMAQQAAMEAQQQAQAQMQAMGVPPEQMQQAMQQGQEAGVAPDQTMQAMQMGQQQDQQQAQQKQSSLAVRKLAGALPHPRVTKVMSKAVANKIMRAVGDHPAAIAGIAAGLIGGGSLALHLLHRAEMRDRAAKRRVAEGFDPLPTPGQPERLTSSSIVKEPHGQPTVGRSLRGFGPDIAWATPKKAGFSSVLGEAARVAGGAAEGVGARAARTLAREAAGAPGALQGALRKAVRPGLAGRAMRQLPLEGGRPMRAAFNAAAMKAPPIGMAFKPRLLSPFRKGLLAGGGLGAAGAYYALRGGDGGAPVAAAPQSLQPMPAAPPTPYSELVRETQGLPPTRMQQLRGFGM